MAHEIGIKMKDGSIRKYSMAVFVIKECNVLGRPWKLEMIDADEMVTVEDGMRFMTGFIPTEMLVDKLVDNG